MGRLLVFTVMPAVVFVIGFAFGAVPGLVAGLLGWYQIVAIVPPVLWALAYIYQRNANFGDVNFISFIVAGFSGFGWGVSVWLFGSMVSE